MIKHIRESIAYLLIFAMITTTFQPVCAVPVANADRDGLELGIGKISKKKSHHQPEEKISTSSSLLGYAAWGIRGAFTLFASGVRYITEHPGEALVGFLALQAGVAKGSNVIQLNEYDPFSSSFPHSVFLTNNTTAASWIGATSGGGVSGFSARSFGIDGPITGEINSQVTGNQAFFTAPPIRNSGDEVFQVYTGSPSDIIAGRGYFLTNGTASTPIQPISSSGRGFRPDTTTDSLGLRHTVVWYNPDTDEVYGQVVNSAGETQLIMDALLFSNATNPDHARLPNGQLVVVSETLDGGIVARRFDTSFNPLSQQVLVSSSATIPNVGALADNGVLTVYEQDDHIVGLMLDQNLSPQTMEVQISGLNSTNNMNPMVGILPDTLFETFPEQTAFVLWSRQNASNTDVYARLMTRNLIPLSEEFILNEDQVGFHGFPSLSVSPDGLVFTTWQNSTQSSFGRFLNQTFLRSLIGEFPSITSTTSQTTATFDVPSNGGTSSVIIGSAVAAGVGGAVLCCVVGGVTLYFIVKRKKSGEFEICSDHSNNDVHAYSEEINLSTNGFVGSAHPSAFDPQREGYTTDRLTFTGAITERVFEILDSVSKSEAQDFQPFLAKPIEPADMDAKRLFDKQSKAVNPLRPARFDFEIDRGNFGTLYLGMTQGEKVAIKVVTGNGIADSLNEGRLMDAVGPHPNVMTLLDYKHNRPDYGLETLNQVMDLAYCNGEHFARMLTAFDPKRRVALLGDAFAQLMSGLTHIHRVLEHYDIKLANTLFMLTGRLRIGDFGKAKQKNLKISGPTMLGDKRKLAPEATALLRSGVPEEVKGERVEFVLGHPLDVWASAVSIIEAYGENPEFFSLNLIPTPTRVQYWTYDRFQEHVQSGLKIIPSDAPFLPTLEKCLTPDPKQRMSSNAAKEALNPFLMRDNLREATFGQLIQEFADAKIKATQHPHFTRDQLYQKANEEVYQGQTIEALYPQREQQINTSRNHLYHAPDENVYNADSSQTYYNNDTSDRKFPKGTDYQDE